MDNRMLKDDRVGSTTNTHPGSGGGVREDGESSGAAKTLEEMRREQIRKMVFEDEGGEGRLG
jgi:hypothetical protein